MDKIEKFQMEKTEKADSKENKSEGKRKIVTPGEVLVSGTNYLPGEGTRREGNEILASRLGVLEMEDRLVKVVAISGVYIPKKGHVVLARVEDITFNGWMMSINSPYSSFLPLTECKGFISKRDDLSLIFNYGDIVVAGIIGVKARGTDLTTKDRGLDKLEDGLVITINSNKVPRVIGRQGSMVTLINELTGCEVVVGQNGVIWIKGNSIEDELIAKEAITFIVENSLVEGLTEQVKTFLDKKMKEKK